MVDPSGESHRARHVAESFGSEPESYDRNRPRYPEAMVEAVVASLPGVEVLDVGMGTGIAARQFETAGCAVLGVEVDPRMAEFARTGGLTVEVARFEEWEPAGRMFDAVIAGQTWHWVEPVLGATKAAGVLRQGGRIALFWNVFELPAELRDRTVEVHRRLFGEAPFIGAESGGIAMYAPQFQKAADGIREAGGFEEPEQWQFGWERVYTKAEWLEQVPTYGGYNLLDREKLEALLSSLGEVVDELGGAFTVQYTAVVVTAVRARPGPPPAESAP